MEQSEGWKMSTPIIRITPKRFEDARGWFSEVYNQNRFLEFGLECQFVQENQSLSRSVGIIRGLHFQLPPHAQDKLVRCIRGRIFDVAVDIRRGSETYGRWVGVELSAENGEQLFIPTGFAHGFVTLEPDCEVLYKVSSFYAPSHDRGLRWNDPDIAIDWPLMQGGEPILSDKDREQGLLADFDSPFAYDGSPLKLVSV